MEGKKNRKTAKKMGLFCETKLSCVAVGVLFLCTVFERGKNKEVYVRE